MNNKEFITELSLKMDYSTKQTTQLTNALIDVMASHLEDEDSINIVGFGSFDVKKKLERVLVNPQTKLRMLVPPKMTINFKPNASLKGRAKDNADGK